MKPKRIYKANGEVLGLCEVCGTENYVEPHGETAACKRCRTRTTHRSVPSLWRDTSHTMMVRRED
jgi:uncharacterized membrane protein